MVSTLFNYHRFRRIGVSCMLLYIPFLHAGLGGMLLAMLAVHYIDLYAVYWDHHWSPFLSCFCWRYAEHSLKNVKGTNHRHFFRVGLYMLTRAAGGFVEGFESRRYVPTWIRAHIDKLALCICRSIIIIRSTHIYIYSHLYMHITSYMHMYNIYIYRYIHIIYAYIYICICIYIYLS